MTNPPLPLRLPISPSHHPAPPSKVPVTAPRDAPPPPPRLTLPTTHTTKTPVPTPSAIDAGMSLGQCAPQYTRDHATAPANTNATIPHPR
jgi:hypothetical protein